MNDGSVRELSLTVEPRMLPLFFHFLQDGFLLETQVGLSIREFLRDQCRIPPDTITDLISTVFLDGMPVDDLDRAFVENHSTLALSGAMPGLVGAVMRSNSPLRSFRSSITHTGENGSRQHEPGLVRLKLFNKVMSELGPGFLREGILLEPLAVKDFLTTHSEIRVSLDEDDPSGGDLVSLSVRTHE